MSNQLIKISRDDLKAALSLLAINHVTVLDKLNDDHPLIKAKNMVSLAVSILNGKNYGLIVDMLNDLPRPTNLVPNSAGAFLFGSYQDCYGDVDKQCSAIAIGSINDGSLEWADRKCADNVWVFRHDRRGSKLYSCIYRNDSDRALVYVDHDYSGFSPHEIGMLRDSNINYVSVYNTSRSRHHEVLPFTHIDELKSVYSKGSNVQIETGDHPGTHFDARAQLAAIENNIKENIKIVEQPWAIIISVAVIIFLAVICWWLFYRSKNAELA